jgi:NhaB family Na+:H+ antiporter
LLLETLKWFSYGVELRPAVRDILQDFDRHTSERRTTRDKAIIIAQALTAVFLVVALANHLAEVGMIGLAVIVLATVFTGVTEEHRIGHAFQEALPFTALLVVFFVIVAVIDQQELFTPVIDVVLALEPDLQGSMFYLANGVLSMISDNVFVATVYISEVKEALLAGDISREQFDILTIAINTGTNLPSVATPNGQAAFLFLLTSAIAPLIRLSYGRMVWMALPYTLTMTATGFWAVTVLL